MSEWTAFYHLKPRHGGIGAFRQLATRHYMICWHSNSIEDDISTNKKMEKGKNLWKNGTMEKWKHLWKNSYATGTSIVSHEFIQELIYFTIINTFLPKSLTLQQIWREQPNQRNPL